MLFINSQGLIYYWVYMTVAYPRFRRPVHRPFLGFGRKATSCQPRTITAFFNHLYSCNVNDIAMFISFIKIMHLLVYCHDFFTWVSENRDVQPSHRVWYVFVTYLWVTTHSTACSVSCNYTILIYTVRCLSNSFYCCYVLYRFHIYIYIFLLWFTTKASAFRFTYGRLWPACHGFVAFLSYTVVNECWSLSKSKLI